MALEGNFSFASTINASSVALAMPMANRRESHLMCRLNGVPIQDALFPSFGVGISSAAFWKLLIAAYASGGAPPNIFLARIDQ